MIFVRRFVQSVLFYVLLGHLAAMSLTWNLVAALLHPFLSRENGIVVGRAAISSVYRGFWTSAQWCGLMRIDYEALDVLRRDAGLIIAANHPSMLDALLIVARVPRGIRIRLARMMQMPRGTRAMINSASSMLGWLAAMIRPASRRSTSSAS